MELARKGALLRVGLIGAGLVLLARTVQVQLVEHDDWSELARITQGDSLSIPARRGPILANDGSILAESVTNWSLAVDVTRIRNAHEVARSLDSLGLIPEAEFHRRIAGRGSKRFVWLQRGIVSELALDPLLRRYPELIVRTEDKRLYPMGKAGGPVLGLVGRDQTPLGGLESVYDEVLRGRDGWEMRVSDATGEFEAFQVTVVEEPVPGCALETTLHPRMQEIALARLEAGVAREGARRGFCIILRPQTGEILAMVQVPAPDPGDPSTWNAENLKVCPAADCLEPGSSYKLVTFAGALEAGILDEDEPINCLGGRRPMPGGRPITDHDPYGVLATWEVLAHSSNIGTGLLAERLGAERFYRMERAFGFGLPTGVPLPGEGRGRIAEPAVWSARSLATMAFGQEVSCTALQMAMAYAAVANGGNLMKPLLVRAVRASDGTTLERNDPEVVRPVLSQASARRLRTMLRRVVTDGTGKKAEIDGLRPAGKTSTAQKYIPEECAYSSRRYIGSFVGFAPYDDPQIVCLILMDEPRSSIYGGSVAAPLFREVVSDVMPFLGGERSTPADSARTIWAEREPDPRREVPAVVGLPAATARRVLREAGFRVRLTGGSGIVTESRPAGGERRQPETLVTLVLGGGPDSAGGMSMPDLRGLALRDALLRIRSCGGEPRVTGSGWVLEQVPPPGEAVRPGQMCCITLGPDSCRAYSEFLEGERRASWAVAAGGLLAESP